MMSHGTGEEVGLHHLLAGLPVMSVLTRATDDGVVIQACNDQFADRLGYDRTALLGKPLADYYTPESAAEMECGGYERALSDEFTVAERDLLCANGTVLNTTMRAVPRTDGAGRVVGTWAVYVDETRRRQQHQQTAVLNRLLRHNLRNDLTVILGHGSMLAERLEGRERESLAYILDTARRWEQLTTKVQRLQQIVSTDPSWSRTDLTEVLERVESRLNDRYPDAKIRILRPAAGTATVRPEIEFALVELCENAIAHADHDAPEVVVTVGVPSDEPWVKLTVADDSPAIPESELLALRNSDTTPLLHATGLGLWLVRFAVDRVGGDVTVVDNDDTGTSVTIRYPAD